MKKSLLWLYPHLNHMDGGTKFVLEVAKRLSKDYRVTILTNCGKKGVIKQFENEQIGVRTYSFLSADSNIYWLFLPFFLVMDFLSIIRFLKSSDIILATLYPSNFLAYLYSRIFRKPFYYYCYEPFPYLQNTSFIKNQRTAKRILMSIFSFCYRWTDMVSTKHARKVFTLNSVTQKMIKKIYNINAVITYMGVDTTHFKHYQKNSLFHKYRGRILITHSTDYSRFKRTDLAIKTISYCVSKYPQILLLITSTNHNNPEKSHYVNLVRTLDLTKHVMFLDFVDYQVLPKYYSASICYLSSSHDEMLGTTSSNLPVKEALACETPAIRSGITDEDVTDGISGFLADPRDTKSVAQKIMYLIENKKKAKEMGKKGRKVILNKYSWDIVALRITEHLT